MRKILYFIVTLFAIIPVNSQCATDTIPNGSFETWWLAPWAEDPAYWITSNSDFMAPNVIKDSDAYSGSFGMELTFFNLIEPQAMCGFRLSSHPANMGGYVKNHLNIYDSTVVVVQIYYNQQIVDSGLTVFYGGINPNYSSFIVPISQNSSNADSCVIHFRGGMSALSSITFDDIQFDFAMGIPERNGNNFSIYPNPCRDHVTIRSGMSDFIPIQVEAYDILGRKQEIPFDKNRADDYIVEMNTSALHSGIWIVTFRRESQTHSMLLIKD